VTEASPEAEAESWHRLHPLSPLIQAGRLVAGLFEKKK